MFTAARRCSARMLAPRALRWVWALLCAGWFLPLSAANAQAAAERDPPTLSLSAKIGAGYMRGGQGGLMAASRAPLALDVEALALREPRYLIGGALRIELEGVKSVAGIFRFALRHPFGPLELRPGVGVPFYFAPRTMIGPEASLTMKLGVGTDLGILLDFAAAAFVAGDDVPKGQTVIMLHVFLGIELFI